MASFLTVHDGDFAPGGERRPCPRGGVTASPRGHWLAIQHGSVTNRYVPARRESQHVVLPQQLFHGDFAQGGRAKSQLEQRGITRREQPASWCSVAELSEIAHRSNASVNGVGNFTYKTQGGKGDGDAKLSMIKEGSLRNISPHASFAFICLFFVLF